ncbi:MAG: hypothetical protein AAF799_26445 [Myxococcota bacterium]
MFHELKRPTIALSMLALTISACLGDDEGRPTDESERADGDLTILEKRIAHSRDDAEEKPSGTVYLTSSDLELAEDGVHDTELVGLRFTNVEIPEGATVEHAYVQFTADEKHSGATSLVIHAQAADDARRFRSRKRNISNRALTEASVEWNPAAWNTKNVATDNERTPDISGLLQELVDRPGWNEGNDIALIISGSGTRTADSYDGSSSTAPLLHVEYTTGTDDEPEPDDPDTDDTDPSFELPIEVLGAPGTTASRSFTLDGAAASQASELYLQINNLSYENKARVRINGGSWTSLDHDAVSMFAPEAARGGMTHGGYSTIRMTMPVPGSLQSGENTVEFEFTESDGISMGYRVIDFNLLDEGGEPLIEDAAFGHEDPEQWSAPRPDADDIEAGGELWRERNRLVSNYLDEDGFWYDNSIPAGRDIKASCADCHTEDGRDLELFAYSNHSIIERAKFHGLSTTEGEQIASYIRSLSADPEIGRYGRPWDPPFQPGPSIATRPVHEWPAGAGLDAVLEHDADMLDTMLPNPSDISQADVDAYFDHTQMVNPVVQPLAIQFPDWKRWLPLVHPMDAFAREGYWEDGSIQYSPKREYERIRADLLAGGYDDKKDTIDEFRDLSHSFRQFLAQGGSSNDHWRTDDGDAFTEGLVGGISKELAATSLGRLQAVKFFEFHTEFSLMGMTDDEPGSRERQFIGRSHQVFNVPPHFTGCYDGASCDNFDGQSEATGEYESTTWYQMAQVLNPGNEVTDFLGTVDYNYQPMFIMKASASSGVCEPVRYYYSQLIHFQTRARTDARPQDKDGFYIRQKGPWQLLGRDNRNRTLGLGALGIPGCLDDIQPGLGSMVVEAQLRNFMDVMNEDHNDLDDWPRRSSASSGNSRYLETENISQSAMPDTDGSFSGPLLHYVHKIYATMNEFIELGVDCPTFEAYRDWASEAWPNVDWEQFECAS